MRQVNNIQTLEQAELTIRRAGIVQNEMVEGKQLLEICGFEASGTSGRDNSKLVIDRQIERHNLKAGEDFTVNIVVDGRIRRNVYHFTINAANHVLLAAMTKEGKAARQEAINLKLESLPPSQQPAWLTGNEFLNALIQTQLQTDAIERQQVLQSERLDKIENDIQARVLESCPPNMLSITGVRKVLNDRYGLSTSLVNFLMSDYEAAVPVKAMVRNAHEQANGSSYAVYCKTSITKMVKTFLKGVVQVSATQYVHPAYHGRFSLNPNIAA